MKQKLRINFLQLQGGEPLLHSDLQGILDEALQVADRVQLTTNGLLLSKNKWLLDYLSQDNFEIYISYQQKESMIGKSKYDEIFFDSLGKFLNKDPSIIFNRMMSTKDNRNTHKWLVGPNVYLNLTYRNWRFPEMDEDDIPKPHSSDYIIARNKMCQCPVPFIFDKKIYKCNLTATLPMLLTAYDRYDDAVWEELRKYKPYDLENDIGDFTSLTRPESVCSLCPERENQLTIAQKFDKHSKMMNTLSETPFSDI
jgi:MoaA/NifB/PqqE/SkfB family radical SAM enzyme